MARDPLDVLATDLRDFLRADDYCLDIPVEFIDGGTAQGLIDMALAGTRVKASKVGAAISVLLPAADVTRPNAAGPLLEPQITVRVQTIPVINQGTGGTAKSTVSICRNVAQRLHHFSSEGYFNPIYPVEDFLTPKLDEVTVGGRTLARQTYDLVYRVQMPLGKLAKVSRPVITDLGNGAFSIACATAGATIYFTLDETFPWIGNAAATQGSSGQGASSPTVVRAAAYKAGLVGSDVAVAELTWVAGGSGMLGEGGEQMLGEGGEQMFGESP